MSEGADVSLLEDEARQTTEDGWLKSCMIYNIVICLYLLGYGVWMGDISIHGHKKIKRCGYHWHQNQMYRNFIQFIKICNQLPTNTL